MKIKEGTYDEYIIECSGRELYAHNHIVGIAPDLETSQGYDGSFQPWDDGRHPLTKAEREEIADYMISLWQQWKNKT